MKIKAEVTSEDGIHWEIKKVLYVTDKGRVTIECYKIKEQLKGKNLVADSNVEDH